MTKEILEHMLFDRQKFTIYENEFGHCIKGSIGINDNYSSPGWKPTYEDEQATDWEIL